MLKAAQHERWAEAAHMGTHLGPLYATDSLALFTWADAMRRAGDLDPSITAYEKLVALHPQDERRDEAILRIANLLVRLERREEALAYYRTLAEKPASEFRKKAALAVDQLLRTGGPSGAVNSAPP
jgi:tetratricopeptide (TPR) repeat protein